MKNYYKGMTRKQLKRELRECLEQLRECRENKDWNNYFDLYINELPLIREALS